MKFGYQLNGLKDLEKKFNTFSKEVLAGQVKAVQESTFMIHGAAVKLIQDNSDGKAAIRFDPKRSVNVSRPGTPPNTDTGRLVQSIKFDFKKDGLIGRIGSNLKYAKFLEFGTSNMSARPWLSTAVLVTSKEVAEVFRKAVRRVVKGSGI